MTEGSVNIKVNVGKYRKPVTLIYKGSRIFVKFKFNRILIAEVKAMQGAKWHGFDEPPRKLWSIANSPRNHFQLEYLQGKNPYAWYDQEITDLQFERPLREHQKEMTMFVMVRRHCIISGEMGTGKSLVAIEVMERMGVEDHEVWYVAPRSGLRAVNLELDKWDSKVRPVMFTYAGLVSRIKAWSDGDPAPKIIVLDESSKIKTYSAQRSESAMSVADAIREEYGYEGIILEMSGTPAPKSPVDWWHQCLTADTLILTSEGYKTIRDLWDQTFILMYGNTKYKIEGGAFKTGNRDVYKLTTLEGYSIKATIDHQVAVDYDGFEIWKELGDLVPGDKIKTAPLSNVEWGGFNNDPDAGYVLGYLIGDGNIYIKDDKTYATLQFFDGDYSIMQEINRIIPDLNIHKTGDAYRCQHMYINKLVREFNIDTDKNISILLSYAGSEFLKGFLSGFFDADGSVEESRLRIELGQTNRQRIEIVQLMLSIFGIFSNIKKRTPTQSKIDGRIINSKPSNRLHIVGDHAVRFATLIGFRHKNKFSTLKEKIFNRHRFKNQDCATFKSLEPLGIQEVFEITVPEIHRFIANGLDIHNCEVACPGFLREGQVNKFKSRLCLVEERQSITGGVYPHIVTWLDDEDKCQVCGQLSTHENHDVMNITMNTGHSFEKSVNEVARLYKRMEGLVLVKLKKDCLDLPDKQYEIIRVRPTPDMLRAARIIRKRSTRAIEALTLLRELSDGFQYTDEVVGENTCPQCNGTGKAKVRVAAVDVDIMAPQAVGEQDFEIKEVHCDTCGGVGKVKKYKRATDSVESPKDEAFIDELDMHEDIGRYIVWGGFTGTIDRLVDLCHKYGWATLRIDGRGFVGMSATGEPINDEELLISMDRTHPRRMELLETYPKLCVVGHPQAGGMGLNLTASPTALFYSNCFNGEARMQAEDRIHRMGMDENRGATIKDIIHLNTDQLVLDNLKKKKRLQSISMGELGDVLQQMDNAEERVY